MLSVKQGDIKYHFLSLWHKSAWDWTPEKEWINDDWSIVHFYLHFSAVINLRGFFSQLYDIKYPEVIQIIRSQFQVLYSHNHNDINHNGNTDIYAGGLCCFRYERVYKFMTSVHGDTKREPQFLKVNANHATLTPSQRVVHLVMFKISIHLCRLRSEKLNCMPQR